MNKVVLILCCIWSCFGCEDFLKKDETYSFKKIEYSKPTRSESSIHHTALKFHPNLMSTKNPIIIKRMDKNSEYLNIVSNFINKSPKNNDAKRIAYILIMLKALHPKKRL